MSLICLLQDSPTLLASAQDYIHPCIIRLQQHHPSIRIATVTFQASTSPLTQSPITHIQHFQSTGDFLKASPPLSTQPPPLPPPSKRTVPGQAILEGLVSTLELFDLHPASSGESPSSDSPPSTPVGEEKYLIAFLATDPFQPSHTWPPISTHPEPKVRWNRDRKLDGIRWAGLKAEFEKRKVRCSFFGLGAAQGERFGKVVEFVKSTGKGQSVSPWFGVRAKDLVILNGFDPPSHKRSASTPQSTDSAPKRARLAPPTHITLTPTPTPSLVQSPAPDPRILLANRIRETQANAQLALSASNGQLLSRSVAPRTANSIVIPGNPPSSQPPSQPQAQAQTQGQTAPVPAPMNPQTAALAQQYYRQKLQAQGQGSTANAGGGGGGNVSAKPFVWNGEISWSVHSQGGKPGAVLGCKVSAFAAHAVPLDDFQTHLWPNRLHLSAVSPLMINELRNYVTNGRMPCVSLHHAPLVGASKEDAQRGEQSYSSLAKNLEGKKTMGHIRFGPAGCGMIIFPMGGGPNGPVKLMGMLFLTVPIPFVPSGPSSTTGAGGIPPNPVSHQQQQQQQQQRMIIPQQTFQTTSSPMIAPPNFGQQQQQQQQVFDQAGQGGGLTNEQIQQLLKARARVQTGLGGNQWL